MRPVLVWFHGGGFEAGSSIEHIAYEGENMSRRGDAVVVSINHRLNVLGYFDLSAFGSEYANSGNAGMDDIIASLKWVQENIEKFGGDPKNVSIWSVRRRRKGDNASSDAGSRWTFCKGH